MRRKYDIVTSRIIKENGHRQVVIRQKGGSDAN